MTGKVYVGQTWRPLAVRFKKHCEKNPCVKLYRAIKKYGKDAFTIKSLTIAHTQEVADYWESYFIKKYNSIASGYNLRTGGSRGAVSDETRQKMTAYRNKPEVKARKRISAIGNQYAKGHSHPSYWTGKKRPQEWCEKHAVKLIGNPQGKACKGKTWKMINGKRVWQEKQDVS